MYFEWLSNAEQSWLKHYRPVEIIIASWFLQGAAINRSVLKHLSPAVVLVEEAAEILEPQVLASLNSNLQHLILIGDHHQLRPQVESYDLERW